MTEVGGQMTEVRSQNSEFGKQRTEECGWSCFTIQFLPPVICSLLSDICPLSSLLIGDASLLESQHLFKHAYGAIHNAHRKGSSGALAQAHAQIKNGLQT